MASQMKDMRAPEWLYHRHSSERQFQTHSPGWQDGRWCGGNNESLSGALFSTLFSLHQRIFLNFLLFFSLLPPPPPPTLLLLLFHLSLSVCIMWCFHCGYNSANRCWPPGSAASLHIAFSPLALSDIHIRSQTLTPLSRRSLTIPHFREKKTAPCEDGDLARFIFFT